MKLRLTVLIILATLMSVLGIVYLLYRRHIENASTLTASTLTASTPTASTPTATSSTNAFITLDNTSRELITRFNTQSYFTQLDSDYIKVVNSEYLESVSKSNFDPNTILIVTDDSYNSSCISAKNLNGFLDNPNIALCVAANWFDVSHPKLKMWPIGLESRMFEEHFSTGKVMILAIEKGDKPTIPRALSNAHFNTYPNPNSGYRDDRSAMISALRDSPIVDFWDEQKGHKETIPLTQEYMFALCPEGNGLDTHRFYEAYSLGVRPIVRRGPLTPLHERFPGTVVVDKWEDVYTEFPTSPHPFMDKKFITMGYWLYQSLRPRCRIVNFFTGGLCIEWRNFLESVRRLGLIDLVTVFVLDTQAKICAEKEDVDVRTDLLEDTVYAAEADFQTAEFARIVAAKVQAIEIMLREGFFVFYMDTDIVLLRDPIEDYFKLPPKRIYMQSDRPDFELSPSYYCSGVIFMAPSSETADIMERSYHLILKMKAISLHDQEVLNNILTDVGTLSPGGYPNGNRFFEKRSDCWENPVLVHNNYIIGLAAKIQRFKDHGLWFVH
jgi:hypothetical protein